MDNLSPNGTWPVARPSDRARPQVA